MADLFTSGQGQSSPAASQHYAASEPGDEASERRQGAYRQADIRARLVGSGPVGPKAGLFRYDVARGAGVGSQIVATRSDRMDVQQAGETLHSLHVHFGVAGELEGVLSAFDRSLFFCHTLNSASVLEPGRAQFGVVGVTQMFAYKEVQNVLGNDFRRFFRAFADEVARVNQQVINDYTLDPRDPVKAENHALLISVASERSMMRYPHLCHDSADACSQLNMAERATIAASKLAVIGATPNSVDGTRLTHNVTSADRLNSTNLKNY